jgi:hypothetical protein
LATERKMHSLPMNPGVEIHKMLEDWDERNEGNVTSEEKMYEFTTELWLSLQQYEHQMRE